MLKNKLIQGGWEMEKGRIQRSFISKDLHLNTFNKEDNEEKQLVV